MYIMGEKKSTYQQEIQNQINHDFSYLVPNATVEESKGPETKKNTTQ